MTKWLFPKEPTEVPFSELAMHVGAAGQKIIAFIRTGKDFCHIMYKDGLSHINGHPYYNFTMGLTSELIPFNSKAYNDCLESEIYNHNLIYNKIRIIYFKQSGKYYTEGYYNSIYDDYRIFDEIREMFKNNYAPGLNGCDPDFTAVVIPEDVHYSAMIRIQ